MGLDISYFSKVERVGDEDHEAVDRDYLEGDGTLVILYSTDFPERADGLTDGTYRVVNSGGFRAGSYSGYNRWREELAAMLGTTPEAIWDHPEAGPFVELIHFADNEGVIGPETSAKLARDFVAWRDRALAHPGFAEFGGHGMAVYDHFAKAFRVAAPFGAVKFH